MRKIVPPPAVFLKAFVPLMAALFLFFPAAFRAEEGKIASSPGRLVSLSPLLTENIFLLGAGEALVGDTIYCVHPEAARHKEKVGSAQEVSIERVLALKPDLTLASNLNSPQQVARLRDLGFKVEVFPEMASFADICGQFLRLGGLLGREKEAEAIVGQAQARVEAVRQAVAGLPRKRVLLQVGASPLFSSVNSSFTHDFIEFGGGVNIAGDRRSGAMSTEQVLALDPEVILIAVMGAEGGVGAREKERWQGFSTLSAVRNGQIYVLDPDPVCSPSPQTFAKTLSHIARLIHPQAIVPDMERAQKD